MAPQASTVSHGSMFQVSWSCSSNVFHRSRLKASLQPAFSEVGSWLRGLSAAFVSAAGGAAPKLKGQAASWSWTRSTAGNTRIRIRHQHAFGPGQKQNSQSELCPLSDCRAARRMTVPLETPGWSRSCCCWDRSGASCSLKMQRRQRSVGSPDPNR